MQVTTEQAYQVLLTRTPMTEQKDGDRWWATLLGFPFIVEEATSRDQAIIQLKSRITDMVTHTEVITVHAPALPVEINGTNDELTAKGWHDFGMFKEDDFALQLFDEIEQERDRHLVGEQ